MTELQRGDAGSAADADDLVTRPAGPSVGVGGGFAAVDDGPDPALLVAALDAQAALPAIQRLRAAAIEWLSPRPGDRLLDAGCGTGDVALLLAGAVAPGGSVLGVDRSELMLATARQRGADRSSIVEFRAGDITRLEVADAAFDGVCSERVLQHLDDPAGAVAELVRVTRPGGRVVVIDTDWGMHAIAGADPALTARVTAAWAAAIPNAWSGRRLPALLTGAGLPRATVVAEVITATAPPHPDLQPFAAMAEVARQRGALTGAEVQAWLAQLTEAAALGTFLWSVALFAVAATRP